MTLESARIAGLDPRAFDAAIQASDSGQATDDIKLRQIVEPVLSGGALAVASAQIPFNIRDGRIRIGATTLDAEGARAIISGGYDIPGDQTDIRVSLASTAAASTTSRPEIQVFAVGSPDALDRTVDVAALSSWLAVRAIDRETRRLDSIERGEPPPAVPASIPPAAWLRHLRRAAAKTKSNRAPSADCCSNVQSAGCQPAGSAAAAADRGSPGSGYVCSRSTRPPKPRAPLVLTPQPQATSAATDVLTV